MAIQKFTAAEERAMQLALGEARRGIRGANPLVGAAVLDADGAILASGHHRGAGFPHAEIEALANLPEGLDRTTLAGCTMVVTLEPCNHQGRTGPCAVAVAEAGIGRLVHASDDQTAAAGGADYLRSRGVDVRSGLCRGEALELNQRWFKAKSAQRPFTTMHIAQTLDGLIAAADGSSQWITSEAARQDSHGIRARVDAIIAGTGTVFADNPRLTARSGNGEPAAAQPLRVVMGARDVPDDAAVRGSDGKFLQLHTHDPAEVLDSLARRGVAHAMIEGGATVAAAFLKADLVDELVLYLAPLLLGAGTRSTAPLGISTLADAAHWRWDSSGGGHTINLGADLRLHLEPAPAGTTPAVQKGL
ncbi:bifunctional diaminohydroxyphosphoribosylaminopyrimidine deaminase/5-amino-6-(5-phosphoribosylamino)uracil reductase RibD [Arthrobacter sp. USHLN218]|uniref:bifunctional diaminohydroxyphosphoribosylaminopyrimidine deaminase/5-amino-6-(5-phosphoribosylamino)uracil reductase RibD n=1 Tax=Arthrobacter sp. USHLN218 TaxID=3081232 RepID=UPI003017AC4F